jgi:Ca2+-binding EF-hand superfamily protein
LQTPESELDKEAVDLVVTEANMQSKSEEEDVLRKDDVIKAVMKYGEYVHHCKTIRGMFQMSDTSNDGKLQRDELRKMIETYESKKQRSTEFCKNVLIFVTEEDLNFILQSADENKDGDIDPTEVMQAVGAWEELAEAKLEEFDKMKCCDGCAIC